MQITVILLNELVFDYTSLTILCRLPVVRMRQSLTSLVPGTRLVINRPLLPFPSTCTLLFPTVIKSVVRGLQNADQSAFGSALNTNHKN